jgi:hypothetical protein
LLRFKRHPNPNDGSCVEPGGSGKNGTENRTGTVKYKTMKPESEPLEPKNYLTEMKRKMIEESSRTDSCSNEEQLLITTVTKKFKIVEEDSILFCDDDKENDEIELF